jgi:hypothetical protein
MGRDSEGKVYHIKNNMSGDDDVIGGVIETLIAFVIGRVSEEGTSGEPGCQFMSWWIGEVGIASTIEHLQVFIGGATPWRATYGQDSWIVLLGRWSSRYVAVWRPSIR